MTGRPADHPVGAHASEESRPLISILIVNYHAYDELDACLESVRRYVAPDLEVLVVDHASLASVLEPLARKHPWVRWLPTVDNLGFAGGVNRGARDAKGSRLLLLNPDTVVNGDVAHELAACLDASPRVAVAGGSVYEADGSRQASARHFPNVTTGFAGRTALLSRVWPSNPWTRRNLATLDHGERTMEVDWVSGACAMVRREAFDAVGGMDDRFFLYWEDADLCYRLRQRGWLTIYATTSGVTHLTGRSSSRRKWRSLVAFHRSAFRYFWKHASVRRRLAAPLVCAALLARLIAVFLVEHGSHSRT